MKIRSAIALVSLAGVAWAVVPTAPASADLVTVTRCVGTGGAVTVPGDLVVPKGKSCFLDRTTVDGRVTVGAGADLLVTNGTLKGKVVIEQNGYFETIGSSVAGRITSRGGYGVYLDSSTAAAGYSGTAPSDNSVEPFVLFDGSQVTKSVNVASGEVYVRDSSVKGAVSGTGTQYLDIINSAISGKLTVSGNPDGSQVCASEIYGDTSYTGNGSIQLGAGNVIGSCDQVNYWGGNVTISNNTGGVQVSGNIVRGDVSGAGNDPPPTGSHNRVRGTVSGQFVDLQPTPAAQAQARTAAPAPSPRQTKARARQRRAAAVQKATAAGDANV